MPFICLTVADSLRFFARSRMIDCQAEHHYAIATMDGLQGVVVNTSLSICLTCIFPIVAITRSFSYHYFNALVDGQV